MTERDIDMVLELSRTGNITRAAENLFTTQSALTKRLQKLEGELGCPLFLRSRRGIILNSAAEAILPELLNIRNSLRAVHNRAAAFTDEVSGTLEIGVSVNYARFRLPPILKKYMTAYPKVAIHVSADQSQSLYRRLTNGELSIAIIRGNFRWDNGDVLLSEEPVCSVVSKGSAAVPLRNLPLISRRSDREFEEQFARWQKEQDLGSSQYRLRVNDIATCLSMVQSGIGWAVLPEICLHDFDGIIKPLYFSDGTPFTRTTHLLYRQEYYDLPQFRLFLQAILKEEYHQEARIVDSET